MITLWSKPTGDCAVLISPDSAMPHTSLGAQLRSVPAPRCRNQLEPCQSQQQLFRWTTQHISRYNSA